MKIREIIGHTDLSRMSTWADEIKSDPNWKHAGEWHWCTVGDDEDYEKYYFEFLITVDEITKDVSLTVTDFSDDEELEESKMLWTNLVGDLKQVLGAV